MNFKKDTIDLLQKSFSVILSGAKDLKRFYLRDSSYGILRFAQNDKKQIFDFCNSSMKTNKQKNKNRIVVLDTELTGLEIENGDRVISVGIVEVFNNKAMGKKKEWIINPDGRQSHPRALKIHGLTDEFLKTKPLFEDIAQEILDFIGDDVIVHHCWYDSDDYSTDENAVNMELERAGLQAIPHNKWLNMKKWAQAVSPCANSLDYMLDLYKIDRNARAGHHGALIDAKLTAKVYKKMAPVFRPCP